MIEKQPHCGCFLNVRIRLFSRKIVYKVKEVVYLHTAVWSALHFFVDMVCAWAMFAFFRDGNHASFLIYNFCAFALQLPIGTFLDLIRPKYHRLPVFCAALGAFVTVTGALLHPAVLGTGNALFHAGSGIDVLEEDFSRRWKGRALGIFVAPGAIGLYIGMLLGKKTGALSILLCSAVVMAVLLLLRFARGREYTMICHKPDSLCFGAVLIGCAFAVVVLRSWVGLSVSFPWKSVAIPGAALALCAAAGKICGGLLAAKYGLIRTGTVTLLLAAVCYLMGSFPVCGLAAVLLFNMSMPLTLYLLAEKMPRLPGFSFGLLTFGLFLGFLPVYWQTELPINGYYFGAAGSIISCLLLLWAGKAAAYGKVSA